MRNLITELGANAATYEAIALKIVDLIDSTEVSLEVGIIALKTAQLIFNARERDAWDAVGAEWKRFSFLELETSQVSQLAAQV